jgi:hypothetical protein
MYFLKFQLFIFLKNYCLLNTNFFNFTTKIKLVKSKFLNLFNLFTDNLNLQTKLNDYFFIFLKFFRFDGFLNLSLYFKNFFFMRQIFIKFAIKLRNKVNKFQKILKRFKKIKKISLFLVKFKNLRKRFLNKVIYLSRKLQVFPKFITYANKYGFGFYYDIFMNCFFIKKSVNFFFIKMYKFFY